MSSSTLVAVDIEKAGAMYHHPVISVGFSVATSDGTLLEQKKFNISVKWYTETKDHADPNENTDYGDFEPRCVEEFWKKQGAEIKARCLTPAPELAPVAWKNIGNWIDSLEDRYGKVKFLTDNASFDIANIDYNLEKYLGRLPMRYSKTKRFRSVVSADDMFDMMPEKTQKEARERIKTKVQHDHDCLNDSYFILLQYVEAKKYKEAQN